MEDGGLSPVRSSEDEKTISMTHGRAHTSSDHSQCSCPEDASDTVHLSAAEPVPSAPLEAAVCRVCHCEGDDDHPLFHPCRCSGSIRFIHQDCLTSWLNFSKKTNCELCGETFGFHNVYAPDMPSKISWTELVKELYPSILNSMSSFAVILSHMFFVWILIPYVTFLELQYCLYFLLEEKVPEKWYLFETAPDFILMWFLGLSVTFFLCFLSLNTIYITRLLWPASSEV